MSSGVQGLPPRLGSRLGSRMRGLAFLALANAEFTAVPGPPVSSGAVSPEESDYLAREARARVEIDKQLVLAGWVVQSQGKLNLGARPGVAVREFTLDHLSRG